MLMHRSLLTCNHVRLPLPSYKVPPYLVVPCEYERTYDSAV